MKQSMMGKNLRQTIWKSLGRYIAIVAIIALGCSIFVGLRVTKTDMVATGQKYTDEQNMFDLRLLSSYGWAREDVAAVAKMPGVFAAEGSVTMDVFARQGSGAEDSVYRLYSIPESINRVYLLGGRMPQSADECLVDGTAADDRILGTKVTISGSNDEDTLDSLRHHTYTVVGYISTPLYMDMTRGSTSLGSGKIASYIYIPEEAFDVDYYTEINVTIPGNWEIYTDAYTDAMNHAADAVEPALKPLAQLRLEKLREEALELYAEGLQEYEDGLAEYEEAKAEVLQELADALKKLSDGQKEIDENLQKLEDGEKQLIEGEKELQENEKLLASARLEFEKAKADAYAQLASASTELLSNKKAAEEGLGQIEDGLKQIDEGLIQIDDGLMQIEEALPQLELGITMAQMQVNSTRQQLELAKLFGNQERIAQLEATLAEQTAELEGYQKQRQELVATQLQLQEQKEELTQQKAELEQTRKELQDALVQIEDGFRELDNAKLQADSEFASAEAELRSGEAELEKGRKELEKSRQELEDGKKALADAQKELDEGRAEYESGKLEAEAELADAEAKLNDAKAELDDAKATIDDMTEAQVYVLTRNTNAGYLALDSNSDIVSGVSRVFPVFFLLVAALVCITTMTRMVEEERTQIGTLKALGYSNFSIMSKYLFYTGSAAIIGCGLGTILGSIVFPVILWGAYSIIFNIVPQVELLMDWSLIIPVTLAYTAVSMLVTWYCCRRTLQEVPAELIRPKAPTSGKKILLEYLPFWEKISFLNKVMLRNIFRYRQRMLMMLVGIGGCTALLVTGFGLRDSIVDIVDYQFEEISLYDMEIYFSEDQTPQQRLAFTEELGENCNVGFFHQSSVELDFNNGVRDLYLLSAGDGIRDFLDFHRNDQTVSMPGQGEALLSVGVAEAMGIRVGDTILLRNTDMESLTVTVSGIYENHVYNYVIVSPETIQDQWGRMPAFQMAYLRAEEGTDVHALGARISGMDDVMNVSVSQDQADLVNSMMDALISVVITVVVSAGLLAATVLYNLTNININERIREIATIKVLGFNAKETSAYVFKENILLTVMGSVLGLGGGKLLLDFVMSQIKIDMVWFLPRLTPVSYLLSIVLTLVTAILVDLIFYKKLDEINMAEALKSVE